MSLSSSDIDGDDETNLFLVFQRTACDFLFRFVVHLQAAGRPFPLALFLEYGASLQANFASCEAMHLKRYLARLIEIC